MSKIMKTMAKGGKLTSYGSKMEQKKDPMSLRNE